ncbi:MAG: SpoIIE family protein phosphatase [candidate division KSB1 bacterium]|nr:SpoIIE family protein phosphatase [candidate division KSB1 bacterium]
MRTQSEPKIAIDISPFWAASHQPASRAFQEEGRENDLISNGHPNGVEFSSAKATNGKPSAELRTPHFSSDEAANDITVFPYIPRKRQERCGLLIDYLHLPAQHSAGDQVDFLILGENRVGVLLADVAGKVGQENLPIIKTALRSNSAGLSTAATLRYIDQRLSEICNDSFAITAFYSIIDQNKRLLHFASAGHLPMLIYRPQVGKIFLLNTTGSPLGTKLESTNGSLNALKSERVALHQNDLLVLYSDGLLAARNPQGEYLGRQRLVDFVRQHGDLSLTDFLVELKSMIEKFTAGQPATDDITVIAIKNILRDLDHPHLETEGLEIDGRFLTTDEEQAILEAVRQNPQADLATILDQLASSEYSYLLREQVQTYLEQLGRWLKPWQDRNGNRESKRRPDDNATDKNGASEPSTKEQCRHDLLAAFPLRPLLYRRFESHGGSPEVAKALEYFNSGDYQRALSELTRLRSEVSNSAAMHCFFGNLHLLVNSPAQAQQEYQMALQLDPRCVHAFLALSYISILEGHFQAAIEWIATALRFNENLTMYQKYMEKLIGAVERLENRCEWIV